MPGFVYGEQYPQHNDGEVPNVGLFRAEVSSVSGVFTYQSAQYGEKKAIRVEWTLPGAFDSKGRPFVVNKKYNVKLDSGGRIVIDTRPDTKQSLGKDLMNWKPKIVDDLNDLVGQPCQVLIMHKPKQNGGVFANVAQILPVVSPALNANPNGGQSSASHSATDDLPF